MGRFCPRRGAGGKQTPVLSSDFIPPARAQRSGGGARVQRSVQLLMWAESPGWFVGSLLFQGTDEKRVLFLPRCPPPSVGRTVVRT